MEQIYINSELNLPNSQNCIQHITQLRHKLDKIQQIPRHNISGHFEWIDSLLIKVRIIFLYCHLSFFICFFIIDKLPQKY
jgi:hypothetical protein